MNTNFKHILKAGLIIGTLDILAAFLYYFLRTGNEPFKILKFIAGGFFGEKAFTGDIPMYLFGLLFHYLIALCFSLFFFLFFSRIGFLKNYPLVRGMIYGLFVWTIMNLVVVPLSKLPPRPFEPVNVIINMIILIICIGIPLSYLAGAGKKMYPLRS